MLQVNLDGAFLCVREAARVLVGQGQGGSLVGVSSTSAIDGAPGQQHYAASKTALLAVMRALAKDPASGFLATQLNHSLEKKVELLRTAALLPSRT